MRSPGILARLVMPSVLVGLALTLACLLTEHYFLAAYFAVGLWCACKVLVFVWPRGDKPVRPATLPKAWVRR